MISTNARITFVLVACIVAFAAYVVGTWPETTASSAQVLASPYCASTSPSLSLQAKAAYVEDLETGEVIYAKNDSAQLPLASLTKLMTLFTANQYLQPENHVTITTEAMTPEGEGLAHGEVWRVEDLSDYTFVASVNDGAHALALAAAEKQGEKYSWFIDRMNENARTIGLSQTYFTNDTGLDTSSSISGSYGSARDAAKLIAYIVQNDIRIIEKSTVETDTFTPITGATHRTKNTSSFSPVLPGIVASKTGFTDLAGGNLAIVFEPIPGHMVAAAVLGSTREGRDQDMQILAEATKKHLKRVILCHRNND